MFAAPLRRAVGKPMAADGSRYGGVVLRSSAKDEARLAMQTTASAVARFSRAQEDEIIQNHYLSSANLAGSLSGFKVF